MKRDAGTPATTPTQETMPPAELQDQIRTRAYEIYEQAGMRDGFAEQDWLQAEAEILGTGALKAAA